MTQTRAVAVVVGVGAEAGLGAALCRRFARAGMHVLVAGRTAAKIERVAAAITAAGGAATALVTDSSDEAGVGQLFERAAGAGPLAVAVFNTGNNQMGNVLEMDASFFEGVWRTACLGGFLVGREAGRRMAAAGSGTLLFTGATASWRARPPFIAFAAAKAALRALAQGLARELGPQGVHVAHVVIDGGIDGERLRSAAPGFVAAKGAEGLLDLDAIAEAYWFLHAQPRSAWTFELDLRPFKEPF